MHKNGKLILIYNISMKIKKETSSGGIVFKNVKGKIVWLITQHSQHKGWVFPKGLVGDTHKGEATETAALREVEEEGGVVARIVHKTPVETSYRYVWNDLEIHKTVFYYLMEYVSGDPKDHDWEMCDAKFADEKEVLETLTYPSDREAFGHMLMVFRKKTA